MLSKEHAINRWQLEEKQGFTGWDFSHLNGRWEVSETPWNVAEIVKGSLRPTDELLDMGTGGGEFLLSLAHPFNQTAVTEGWLPNYELLQRRLVPLGVQVQLVGEDDQLHFPDAKFDLVFNRHESFDEREVWRVLKPGGLFITQQVGAGNNRRLRQLINSNKTMMFSEVNLTHMSEALCQQGFELLMSEKVTLPFAFLDVGAFVYYAKVIPWEFPNFTVETHVEILWQLEREVRETGKIASSEERFLLVAKKKK